MTPPLIEALRGGLIVSCQAEEGEPLFGPLFMAAMARAAELGGAVAIRANGPDDIRAIRAAVAVPVIGLWKQRGSPVYITPTLDAARAIREAGASVIAVDATHRPDPSRAADLIRQVKELGCLVMADVATFPEGVAAAEAGADLVATTLSGYTGDSPAQDGPDLDLVARLATALPVPVIAEGRIATPEQARVALAAGAHAVVVGTAITRPTSIVQRFVREIAPI